MSKKQNRLATLAEYFNEITQYADSGAEIEIKLENPDGHGWGWTLTVQDAERLEALCLAAARRKA